MIGSSYLHLLDGRLRIKISAIKKSHARAKEVERALNEIPGVRAVQANPTTGNVLVLFDSQRVTHQAIFDTLKDLNCLTSPLPALTAEPAKGFGGKISDVIVQSAVDFALKRMIVALL